MKAVDLVNVVFVGVDGFVEEWGGNWLVSESGSRGVEEGGVWSVGV